jgi:hypothetical protein
LTLPALWNFTGILTTSCALVFTVLGLPIEVVILRALFPLIAIRYVIVAVRRIFLVLAKIIFTGSDFTSASELIEVLI